MLFRRTQRFKKAFKALPADVQAKAVRAFRLLAEDMRHPSLHIKKIQGVENIWEGRIDLQYRFTFHIASEGGQTVLVFRNIDHHDECLKSP
uniref:Cytotoxin n=1 Tax=Anaerolinea thermolimosa TaxID=229919 RepID=A0A7C4PJZ9_9CHLR